MAVLQWDAPGQKTFQAGTDRGVLYPLLGAPGVPWNGLIGVQENFVGGEVTPRYYDGVKYFDEVGKMEFQGVLSAYTYPDEFEVFDGVREMPSGYSVTLQERRRFGLSYRTGRGNDLDGMDFGYRIHLIYNCLAAPATREYSTIAENVALEAFQWTLHTIAPPATAYKPTAHIFVDSTRHTAEEMANFEGILYGTDTTAPYFPSQAEVIDILETIVGYGLTEPLTEPV